MLGLALAPLLHGSVNPDLQTVISGLFGLSLLLLSFQLGEGQRPVVPGLLMVAIALVLMLPLVPVPAALLRVISPERWALEAAFPVVKPRGWIPLAVSVSDTVQRLWEIGLMVAVFCLARHFRNLAIR